MSSRAYLKHHFVGADDAVVPVEPKPADGKSSKWWKWSKKYGCHQVKWPRYGMVSGPKGRAAWAVKDAQFFALAQRRERVILVADFGNGADPAAVLFESQGVRGNTPPSREKGEGATHPIAQSLTASGRGVERTGDTRGQDPVVAVDYGVGYAPEIARCDATREGSSQDYETTTMVVEPTVYSIMPQNSGKDYKARPVDVAQPLMAGGPVGGNQGGDYVLEPTAYRTAGDGAVYKEGRDDAPLTTNTDPNANILAFDTTQITSATNRSNPKAGDTDHPLSAQAHPPAVAFQLVSPAFGSTMSTPLWTATTDSVAMVVRSAVRRLTPKECERLQGFPDDYTLIPWRGKPADQCPDGPRYKALGNSWAVPKFVWLGRRIAALMPKQAANDNTQQRAAA